MRIKDIMEKKYASLQSDDMLDTILELFASEEITSAPVFEKDELVGIVSLYDLARFFFPKDGMPFPFLESHSPIKSGMMAISLAKKPQITLTLDQPVSLALGKLISTYDCIPVMAGKKMVGVVRPEHMLAFFLAERAKMEANIQSGPGKKMVDELDGENSTAIDRMLEIVKREGHTTPKKAARELGITEKTAEDLAKLLGKHKLVGIDYSFLTGMVLRRIEHGGR
jgi:predicted transcriptional regulator